MAEKKPGPPNKSADKKAAPDRKGAPAERKVSGFASLMEELKRAVGMLENKVESNTIDGYITLDELDVSKDLKEKLKSFDRNGDGKLTLDELQYALKKGLSGETLRVVTEARNTVNKEIMTLYTEALDNFVAYKTRLEMMQSQGVEHYRIPELMERSDKIHENLSQTLVTMKRKPEVMSLMRQQIREFIRDVRDVGKAAGADIPG